MILISLTISLFHVSPFTHRTFHLDCSTSHLAQRVSSRRGKSDNIFKWRFSQLLSNIFEKCLYYHTRLYYIIPTSCQDISLSAAHCIWSASCFCYYLNVVKNKIICYNWKKTKQTKQNNNKKWKQDYFTNCFLFNKIVHNIFTVNWKILIYSFSRFNLQFITFLQVGLSLRQFSLPTFYLLRHIYSECG